MTFLQAAYEDSRTYEVLRGAVTAIQEASITHVARNLNEYSKYSWRNSGTKIALGKINHLIRESWLYGWLTAEPEPEVVEIDLRQTVTTGPFLYLMDRTISWIEPVWMSSHLRKVMSHLTSDLLPAVRRSSAIDYLLRLLEPPERTDESRDTK